MSSSQNTEAMRSSRWLLYPVFTILRRTVSLHTLVEALALKSAVICCKDAFLFREIMQQRLRSSPLFTHCLWPVFPINASFTVFTYCWYTLSVILWNILKQFIDAETENSALRGPVTCPQSSSLKSLPLHMTAFFFYFLYAYATHCLQRRSFNAYS